MFPQISADPAFTSLVPPYHFDFPQGDIFNMALSLLAGKDRTLNSQLVDLALLVLGLLTTALWAAVTLVDRVMRYSRLVSTGIILRNPCRWQAWSLGM